MKRLMDRLQRWMDDYSIRKKLLSLCGLCTFPTCSDRCSDSVYCV